MTTPVAPTVSYSELARDAYILAMREAKYRAVLKDVAAYLAKPASVDLDELRRCVASVIDAPDKPLPIN